MSDDETEYQDDIFRCSTSLGFVFKSIFETMHNYMGPTLRFTVSAKGIFILETNAGVPSESDDTKECSGCKTLYTNNDNICNNCNSDAVACKVELKAPNFTTFYFNDIYGEITFEVDISKLKNIFGKFLVSNGLEMNIRKSEDNTFNLNVYCLEKNSDNYKITSKIPVRITDKAIYSTPVYKQPAVNIDIGSFNTFCKIKVGKSIKDTILRRYGTTNTKDKKFGLDVITSDNIGTSDILYLSSSSSSNQDTVKKSTLKLEASFNNKNVKKPCKFSKSISPYILIYLEENRPLMYEINLKGLGTMNIYISPNQN